MKKKWNKVTAALLMLVMVVTTVLGAAPALFCQGRAGHDGTSEIRKR